MTRTLSATAIAVGLALVASIGVNLGMPLPAANAAPAAPANQEWADLSAKLAGINGQWTTETYAGATSDTIPKTAILGNGDVGVTSAGSQGVKTFIVSKGDFWNGNGAGSVKTAGLGGYTIQSATSTAPTTTDLAVGKTVTASTTNAPNPAANAVNGLWSVGAYEGWVSSVGKPQWIRLDLGASTQIQRIVLRHDAASRGSGQNQNTPKAFTVQYSNATTAPGSAANDPGWTTIQDFPANAATASTTTLQFAPLNARWLRVYYTTPTQESNPDSTNNPRARLGAFEVYDDDGTTPPPPPPPAFHEQENILDPSIDTDMSIAGEQVSMHTWQGASDNVVVTQLTSDSTDPIDLQLSTWSGAAAANSAYVETAGVSGSTLWAARTTQTTGSPLLWVSRAALSTQLVGATLNSPTSSTTSTQGTAEGTFTLAPGQTVYVVTGVGGGGQNVPAADALAQAQVLSDQDTAALAALEADKTEWWKTYWLQSHVDLGDPQLEGYYYGAQYVIGSASRAGKQAPGLYGVWYTQDNAQFRGDMHLNYNFQAPWYGVYSSNRPELSLPIYAEIDAWLPEATRRASTYSELRKINPAYVDSRPELADGAGGFLFPVGIGPWGAPTDDQYHQQTSDGLFNATMYIQYWEYTQDQVFLQNELYPYLKGELAFFADWLQPDENGQLNLWAGAHEDMWGRNSSPDVPFLHDVLTTAIQASVQLGVDEADRAGWQDMLDHLAPTPTTIRNGQSVYALSDAGTVDPAGTGSVFHPGDNTVNLEFIQPGDQLNLHSPQVDLTRAQNTITQMNSWGQNNAFPKVFTQAARVGYDPETIISRMKTYLTQKQQTNLQIVDGNHGIEKSGATEAINSMLMQSEAGIIDVFADWPAARDASFTRLLAKGAFEVSAAQAAGVVSSLSITSKVGGPLVLTNPWSTDELTVTDSHGDPVDFTLANGQITVQTDAGETYSFAVIDQLVATATPQVSGTTTVGEVLSATAGDWNLSELGFAYQWKRDGSVIPGAESATYTLVDGDYASTISVAVTASKDGFTDVTAESDPTESVKEEDPPIVSASVAPAAAASGWHITQPTLTISASDGASGVDSIEYDLGAGWTTYTVPVLLEDSVTTIHYRATDVAGNVSDDKSEDVLTDTVNPTVSASLSADRKVTVTGADSGSGIARLEYSTATPSSWSTYSAPLTFDEKHYVVSVRSVDVAGNVSAVSEVEVAGGTLSATSALPGDTIQVDVEGLAPGETGQIDFESTPIHLGTAVVNGSGQLHFTATVPAGVAPGLHHFVISGATSGTVVSLSILVLPTIAQLAATGGVVGGGLVILTVFFLLGGWLMVSYRSRRTASA